MSSTLFRSEDNEWFLRRKGTQNDEMERHADANGIVGEGGREGGGRAARHKSGIGWGFFADLRVEGGEIRGIYSVACTVTDGQYGA